MPEQPLKDMNELNEYAACPSLINHVAPFFAGLKKSTTFMQFLIL